MSKRQDPENITSENNPDITLFNTLHKKKEGFKPLKPGHISMYHCGPTVYNYIHIGNLRSFILADIVRRVFEFNNYTVTQVMNITDIGHLQSDADDGDDKMTLAIKREGKTFSLESMREIANRYYDAFRVDLEKVNILPAHYYPFASDHIAEDIVFVQKLLDKNHAYIADDGVYFDTASLPSYGRLGGTSSENNQENESRLGNDAIEKSKKKNPRDFAVWKFNNELGYNAEFGKGFPGWHIECSAMSMKYLGDTFDLHTGGEDHISVHHNNELAQSEALSGHLLSNYWLHNAFIIMEGGKKMAKSGESFVTLTSLEEKSISPLGFRYWLLGASYRTPMQFSFEAILQSEQAYQNLISRLAQIYLDNENTSAAEGKNEDIDQTETHRAHWTQKFTETINDDLDTPGSLALYQTFLKNSEISATLKLELTEKIDQVFGLDLIEKSKQKATALRESANEEIPEHIRGYADARYAARNNKDWTEADRLRGLIEQADFEVKDTADSYILSKRLIQ